MLSGPLKEVLARFAGRLAAFAVFRRAGRDKYWIMPIGGIHPWSLEGCLNNVLFPFDINLSKKHSFT
jgi:hypothetical protein